MNINPFAADESQNINIDKLAQEMALTLKKLNENKQKISLNEKPDKVQVSDNSLGTFHVQVKNLVSIQENVNVQDIKRQKTIKITAIARKKGKTNSDYEGNNDDSQFNDSISNKKITQYFNKQRKIYCVKINKQQMKYDSNQQQNDESQIISHPVLRNVKQKINKKQKTVEQLSIKIRQISCKFQKTKQEIKQKKQNQLRILINFMNKRYVQRIYNQRINQLKDKKQQQRGCKKNKKLIEEVIDKIQLLKNQKNIKKICNNKNRGFNINGNQQASFLQVYSQERQSYLASWKKKLENQKSSLQKQLTKVPFYEEIESVDQRYYPLPDMFQDESQTPKIFQKIYLPLYSRYQNEIGYQIRTLNLRNLSYENLLIMHYPKIMRKQKRMQLKSHIKQIHCKSLELNEEHSNSIFTKNTLFSQIETLSQQYIIIGRTVWQEQLTIVNLKHLMKRYQNFPENIVKYIGKIVLRAHEKIRRQLGIQGIIFPQNIIFNQRNDLKIDNWTANEIYRYSQYQQILLKDSRFRYLPPEFKIALVGGDNHKNNGMGIWTVGVMLYQMIFGKKPFHYEHNVDHEQFYMMTELQFPIKPQVSDNFKELLKMMVCKPQSRITFEKALRNVYFDSKK